MKWLNTKSPFQFAALLLSAATLGLASQSASALTAAGTQISNTASIAYSIGGTPQTPIPSSPTGNTSSGGAGSPTTFLVDRKVTFSLTSNNATALGVTPGQPGIPASGVTSTSPNTALSFTLTNLGNSSETFALTPTAVGTTFIPTGFVMYTAASGVTTFNPAAPGTAVSSVPNLAAGSAVVVFVVPNIPNTGTGPVGTGGTLLNGNQALISLQAQAQVASNLASSVLGALTVGANEATTVVPAGGNSYTAAGVAGPNVNSVDVVLAEIDNAATAAIATPAVSVAPGLAANGANNGIVVATGLYKIQSAAIVVTKLMSPVCDPVNGNTNPLNIPGAAVQWAITIYNPTTDANGIAVTTDAMLTTTTDNAANTTPLTFDLNKITGLTAAACVSGGAGFATGSGLGYTLATTAPAAGAAPTVAVAAGAVTTGASTMSIDLTKVLTAGLATPVVAPPAGTTPRPAGGLVPGEYLTLYFNSFIQ